MPNPDLLRLEKVRVTFDNVPVLHGVDVAFRRGQSVAITGPSGSGKTTLMMLCAGLLQPNDGRLVYDGTILPVHDEAAMTAWRRDNVGIVFQNFHLLPTYTALDNVSLPLEMAGHADPRAAAKHMLDQVGLSHRLDHTPAQLSGGEQQRVALARALARKPSLILADEPTGNLDQATGARVMDLLFAQTAAHGATLVLITHDPALAERCDRQIKLRDGVVHA